LTSGTQTNPITASPLKKAHLQPLPVLMKKPVVLVKATPESSSTGQSGMQMVRQPEVLVKETPDSSNLVTGMGEIESIIKEFEDVEMSDMEDF